MIVSMAKRTGSSSSAVIQNMLIEALEYRSDNNTLLPSGKLAANKNLVPEKAFNAGFEINNLSINGKARYATDAFHHLFQRGGFIEILPYLPFAGMKNPVNAINRREILERVISYLQARLHHPGDNHIKPALFLFFIGKVTVKYIGCTNEGLQVKIGYSSKIFPVFSNRKNSDEALLFDLNNIKYRTFHDMARNGWNRKNTLISYSLMGWMMCEGAVFLSGFYMSRNPRMNWPPHQRRTLLMTPVSDIDFLAIPQRLK